MTLFWGSESRGNAIPPLPSRPICSLKALLSAGLSRLMPHSSTASPGFESVLSSANCRTQSGHQWPR
jgi:hypothetical protein